MKLPWRSTSIETSTAFCWAPNAHASSNLSSSSTSMLSPSETSFAEHESENKPNLFTQEALNELCRDLDLSKNKSGRKSLEIFCRALQQFLGGKRSDNYEDIVANMLTWKLQITWISNVSENSYLSFPSRIFPKWFWWCKRWT